jgi:thymidylate synthase
MKNPKLELTPSLVLDEMFLESMSDAKLLEFTKVNYELNLGPNAQYPAYYFDVDDANAFIHEDGPDGEIVVKPGYLMVKIEAADKAFKFMRKIRYKPEAERQEHFTYDHSLLAGRASAFSYLYPHLNKQIMEEGTVVSSRNGTTREFLNFKTIIDNPYKRCVGGFNRNINIFFLLAEAIWIVRGRDDVAFLKIFNARMADYSDDGKTFHAPYGHRIRKAWGYNDDKQGNAIPYDQLAEALEMLQANDADRRVVISIWDAARDLGTTSKDIPCNDMLMFKVRDKKLYQTIQNRSNDLHWGLPTNVFQFSFLGEVMANILGVELGQQVHNSQSLHVYTDNPIADSMYANYQNSDYHNLYDVCNNTMPMDFKWPKVTATPTERLGYLDDVLQDIMGMLTLVQKNEYHNSKQEYIKHIQQFSVFLAYVTELLVIYVDYTNSKRNDVDRVAAIRHIHELRKTPEYGSYNTDLEFLAINFFVARLKTPHDIQTVNGNYGTL